MGLWERETEHRREMRAKRLRPTPAMQTRGSTRGSRSGAPDHWHRSGLPRSAPRDLIARVAELINDLFAERISPYDADADRHLGLLAARREQEGRPSPSQTVRSRRRACTEAPPWPPGTSATSCPRFPM